MPIQHESQNTFWRSRLNEAAYGTVRASNADFLRILTTDKAPWTGTAQTENDGAYAHGSDRPENLWNTTRDTSKTFPEDFNFTDIGYWLKDTLGSVAVAGSSADKTHTITPQSMATSRQLPSRTYGQKLGALWIDIFTSGCVGSLTISGSRMGRLKVSASVMGNGDYEQDPASYTQPSLSSGLEFGYSNQCSMNVADGGSLDQDISCELEEWSWNFNNNLDTDGFRPCSVNFSADDPESGLIRKEMLVGVRDYKFNATYRLTQADDSLRSVFDVGTIVTLTHTVLSTVDIPTTSTKYKLEIVHTRGRIMEANPIISNGYNAMAIVVDLMSSGGAIPLTATLINNTTSYTT